MKNIIMLLILCTTSLSTPLSKPNAQIITLKWESSEILTDSEGEAPFSQSNPSLKNSIWKARVKHNYIEDNSVEIRQINENSFMVLGSPIEWESK